MKTTKIKEIFKNIKNSITNFVSITIFILLGVAIFQSFDYAGKSVKKSLDDSFRVHNGYDIEIPYVLGCSEDEIESFKEIEDISTAEGYYNAYEYTKINNNMYACKIESLTENINTCIVTDGRLPENDNEIVVLERNASLLGIHLNDTISFFNGNGYSNYLISQLRDINTREDILNIPFDETSNFINNDFTVVGFVTNPKYFGEGGLYYGNYPNSASSIDMVGFVNYSAFNPIITNGYYNNVILKSDRLDELDCTKDLYTEEVNKLVEKVRSKAQEISTNRYNNCRANIDTVLQYESIVTKIADTLYNYSYISEELYNDYNEIKNLLKDYSDNLSKIEVVTISSRTQNLVFTIAILPAEAILKVKYSLGGVFIFVALLICFSTISRLINNDIKLIGTKKALGFRKRELLFTYSGYTLLAAIIGIIGGNFLAIPFENYLVPPVGSVLLIKLQKGYINYSLIFGFAAFILVFIELTTVIACLSTIRKNTVDLLKGDISEEHGKVRFYEKTKLWNKLSLVNKTIVNNAVNEKKRCISTIIAIASITCMIIGSITMNKNVIQSYEIEKSQYFKFDYFLYFDPEVENSMENILIYLEENDIKATTANRELVYLDFENDKSSVAYTLVYYDEESFDELISIDSISKEKFDHNGLWLAESVKKSYKIDENSFSKIKTSSGQEATVNIKGYYKNYSYLDTAFMSIDEYEEYFNSRPSANLIIVNLRGLDVEKIESELKDIKGYQSMFNYEQFLEQSIDAFRVVANALVYLYIIVCILMGFFVILNLLISFVNEKKRELITLMINGYSYKKTCQYIYADTIFLTIIGLVIGIITGIMLGNATIGCFESDLLRMPHTANFLAIVIGCGITCLLVFVMTLISLRKIRSFKLNDINSSNA